jgi:hypothetical protein
MEHVTLNFNNNMSTAAVFLDIEKAFDNKMAHGSMTTKYGCPVVPPLIHLQLNGIGGNPVAVGSNLVSTS